MPVAVITDPTVKEELKSLPGGYVVIRKMTYGQKLTRQQMAMQMKMKVGDRKSDSEIDIDMMNRLTSLWSFANLIEDHNLEDKDGRKLNFKNYADVELLDAVIGEEIDTLIDKHNNFDENSDEAQNLSSGSAQQ